MADAVGLLLVVLLLPLLIVLGLFYLLYSILLRLVIWIVYCTRGVNVLFVYSNSPVWQEYLEKQVIPKISSKSIMLNWSERSKWDRFSLPVLMFWHFGGYAAFNPLAVVFHPFRKTTVFRFWEGFKSFKHGDTKPLESVESAFFKELESIK